MQKVIFITNIPFMKHHVQDMYVKDIAKLFPVEIWDLSAIYNNENEQLESSVQAIKITDVADFKNRLVNNLSSGKVILVTNILCHNLSRIYSVVKDMRVPLVNINKDLLAASLEERGLLSNLKYFNLRSCVFAVIRKFPGLKQYLRKKNTGGYQYDYLMGGSNYYPEQTKKFLRIHQIKYDEFIRAKNAERIVKDKYILFVGAAPTTHPGYTGYPHSLNHEHYMQIMRDYLDKVEYETGLKVVISGHPKGRYIKEEWGNRDVFIGNTADLIHYSEGVISHFSTSLVNAVLEYKPIQIVYSEEMLKSSFRGPMVMGLEFAKLVNAHICNLSNPKSWSLGFDEEAYNIFLKKEIVNDEYRDSSDAELICMYINKIFNKEI